MIRIVRSLLTVLCGYFIVGTTTAAESVLINFDAENPPFMFSKGGKMVGVYPAVIATAMKRIGIPVTLEAKPWKRALVEMDEGKGGVGGIYKNSERVQKYDFSEPILTENTAVYFNKAKPINFKVIADLNGRRVGVIRGWSYGDAFDTARKAGAFTVEEVTSCDGLK